MQIVLLERIPKLGQMGDIVSVKGGYARNFLLPQNKALRATKDNLARFEIQRVELEARDLARKKDAEAVKAKLDGDKFVIIRQSGATGQLYGSVAPRDIVQILADGDVKIARGQVKLNPIKTLGMHTATLVLHPDVECNIVLNIARTEDEAERQAKGEVFTNIPTPDVIKEEVEEAAKEIFDEGHEADLSAEPEEEETPAPAATAAPAPEEAPAEEAPAPEEKVDESETPAS